MVDSATHLGDLDTVHGTVAIWKLRPTYSEAAEVAAYVAVVTKPAAGYAGSAVAMVVGIRDPDEAAAIAAEIRETPVVSRTPRPRWDGISREVDSVYARPHFRLRVGEGIRPAVQVGQFLRESGRLTKHSSTRNPEGDGWALAVGGEIPERTGDETGRLAERMEDWLKEIETEPWW
ncbi:MAG: hypothetical protein ACYC3K_04560 [Candidatus Nanopelagicales bacterium]